MKKSNLKKLDFPPVKHVWSILCLSSSIDKNTNNLSLYNLLEEVTLLKKEVAGKKKEGKSPVLAVLFSFQLITLWEKLKSGPVEAAARIQVVDPKDRILNESEYIFRIEDHQERSRFIASFNALPFTIEGTYQFRVFLKGDNGFFQASSVGLKVGLSE